MSRFLFPRFPAELEEEFSRVYNEQAAPVARIALMLGVTIYLLFYIWDRSVDPGNSWKTLLVRIAVAAMVITALLIPRGFFVRHLQAIMTTCSTAAGIGHIAILSLVQDGFVIGIPGIVLVLMYNFVFFRLLFVPALISGLVTTVGHDAVAAKFFLTPSVLAIDNFFLVSTLVSGAAVAYLLESLFRNQFLTDRALGTERSRTNQLIASIFPAPIVQRLTAGEQVIAESHGEVTVLFSDLVGFTTLTKRLSAGHLVEVLNDYFSTLDRLTEKHRVEKIKTIGDAYMVVSGLGGEHDNSAEHIAEFALEMVQVIHEYAQRHNFPLKLRVGISTGQVISGVIGMKKPTFDLWGETVNFASRMESHSEVGHIQVSEATYWRLQEKYFLTARGDVDVKGIGKVPTYFLTGRKPSAGAYVPPRRIEPEDAESATGDSIISLLGG